MKIQVYLHIFSFFSLWFALISELVKGGGKANLEVNFYIAVHIAVGYGVRINHVQGSHARQEVFRAILIVGPHNS